MEITSPMAFGRLAVGSGIEWRPSIEAIAASNFSWSGSDACTRYFRRNAVYPASVSHLTTSMPSWLQARIVHPPPGATMTPTPFEAPSFGVNTASVGSEVFRRKLVPWATPDFTR